LRAQQLNIFFISTITQQQKTPTEVDVFLL